MGRFRLLPHSRYVFTRPVDDVGRFTFVANAARRANAAQAANAAHFGSEVRVDFFPELRGRQQAPTAASRRKAASKVGSLTRTEAEAESHAEAEAVAAEEFVSGGTVLRGQSEQNISATAPLRTASEPSVTINLRLVGEAPAQRAAARPHAD